MKKRGLKRILKKPERMRSGFVSEKVQVIRGFSSEAERKFYKELKRRSRGRMTWKQ